MATTLSPKQQLVADMYAYITNVHNQRPARNRDGEIETREAYAYMHYALVDTFRREESASEFVIHFVTQSLRYEKGVGEAKARESGYKLRNRLDALMRERHEVSLYECNHDEFVDVVKAFAQSINVLVE